MKKIFENTGFAKKKKLIRCPQCGKKLHSRYGTYTRAHPETSVIVRVQRYRCKFRKCPRVTFSILPYQLLRVQRHTFDTLGKVYSLHLIQGKSQAATARQTGLTRGRVNRLIAFCHKFFPWFAHEGKIAEWGPIPLEGESWLFFTRDFSHSFYPAKWGILPPT